MANSISAARLGGTIVPLGKLIVSLAFDRRIPWETKTAMGLAALYVISPIDGIPDFIPVLGWVEDVAIILLIVDGVLNHLDQDIVREHWKGDPEMLDVLRKYARRATSIIPKAIRDRVYRTAFRGKAPWTAPSPKVVNAEMK